MGFTIETGLSALTVFVQGLLSFFSPCVLPLVPLYLGYLAGGLNIAGNDGYSRGGADDRGHGGDSVRMFLRVVCFTIGIGGAFFVLGLGTSALGNFFRDQRMLFARIGGVLIILFGLYQLGVFGSSRILGKEHRLPVHMEKLTMSPLTAFIMGFAFSFAWTPCVGPALASVLIMAGSAQTGAKGFLLIGVYTVGFILPFLAAGVFTARLLGLFRRHMKVVKYSVKAGGILMILMGVLMFTGTMNDITGYLSVPAQESGDTAQGSQESTGAEETDDPDASGKAEDPNPEGTDGEPAAEENDADVMPAYDFELTDQFGNVHTLEQYRGKVIFLNFWATWCGPCRNEMPEIQKLYEEYAAQGDDAEVIILGTAAPGLGNEGSKDDIISFMEENGYSYPVLLDESGDMFRWYQISAFPTTFMIDRDGNIYGYVTGQLTEDIMRSIIDQTLNDSRGGE